MGENTLPPMKAADIVMFHRRLPNQHSVYKLKRKRAVLLEYVSWRILSFGAKQLLIFVYIYVFINCWCCALVARGVVSCLSVVIFHNKA